MATAQTDLDAAKMPPDLKDRGWKLERKVTNGDEESPDFVAHNEPLGLRTEPFPLAARTIDEARKLDQAHDRNAPRMVPHDRIRLDGGTQPREALDEKTIDDYAEDKKRGDKFPPIDLFFDGVEFWLAGGWHRFLSDRKIGLTESLAHVHAGTRRDAVLFSLQENASHGLRRSNADKRRAVLTLLEDPEWSQWSDNVLAGKAKVSQPYVSTLRRELAAQNVLSEEETGFPGTVQFLEERVAALPPTTTRKGRDGVVRETRNIGRTARPDARVDPGETDIKVDVGVAESDLILAPKAAAKPDPDGWTDEPLILHITINAGKTAARGMLVSGRHGEGKPLFRQFTAGELEPMPRPIAELIGELKKAFAKKSPARAASPSKAKPKARKK